MVFGLPIVKPMWIKLQTLLRTTHLFFFFQAEDGIRDRNLTGVQTCALPIWTLFSSKRKWRPFRSSIPLELATCCRYPARPSRSKLSKRRVTRHRLLRKQGPKATVFVAMAEIGRASCRESV